MFGENIVEVFLERNRLFRNQPRLLPRDSHEDVPCHDAGSTSFGAPASGRTRRKPQEACRRTPSSLGLCAASKSGRDRNDGPLLRSQLSAAVLASDRLDLDVLGAVGANLAVLEQLHGIPGGREPLPRRSG